MRTHLTVISMEFLIFTLRLNFHYFLFVVPGDNIVKKI